MTLNTSEGVALYTDGSSHNPDKSGGWAWVAVDAFGNEESDSGAARDTTNNRMEMHAVIDGLTLLWLAYGPCEVLVRSDSEYVVLGCMNRKRKRTKNVDCWTKIDASVRHHKHVHFEHVRGHTGDHYNEIVDKLAGKARKAGQ